MMLTYQFIYFQLLGEEDEIWSFLVDWFDCKLEKETGCDLRNKPVILTTLWCKTEFLEKYLFVFEGNIFDFTPWECDLWG